MILEACNQKGHLVMIESKFFKWTRQHGGTLIGNPIFGLYRKSMGQRLYDQGRDLWVQVSRHPSKEAAHLFVSRMRKKDDLNVPAPRVIDITLLDDYHVGHIMTFIGSLPLSRGLLLDETAQVPSFFLRELALNLHFLGNASCSFASLRQNIVTRRLHEWCDVPSSLPIKVKSWATIYGGLCWSDLTENGIILGWQNWGVGPKDMDAAWLYVLALKNKNVTRNIELYFPDLLGTYDGLICLLFCSTELLRKADYFPSDAGMRACVETFSEKILNRLKLFVGI